MTDQHPITPPSELVEQWKQQWLNATARNIDLATYISIQAYRAGADQELEACCEWLHSKGSPNAPRLRAARRPKPPSLKEQALAKLEAMERLWEASGNTPSDAIRRALNELLE